MTAKRFIEGSTKRWQRKHVNQKQIASLKAKTCGVFKVHREAITILLCLLVIACILELFEAEFVIHQNAYKRSKNSLRTLRYFNTSNRLMRCGIAPQNQGSLWKSKFRCQGPLNPFDLKSGEFPQIKMVRRPDNNWCLSTLISDYQVITSHRCVLQNSYNLTEIPSVDNKFSSKHNNRSKVKKNSENMTGQDIATKEDFTLLYNSQRQDTAGFDTGEQDQFPLNLCLSPHNQVSETFGIYAMNKRYNFNPPQTSPACLPTRPLKPSDICFAIALANSSFYAIPVYETKCASKQHTRSICFRSKCQTRDKSLLCAIDEHSPVLCMKIFETVKVRWELHALMTAYDEHNCVDPGHLMYAYGFYKNLNQIIYALDLCHD